MMHGCRIRTKYKTNMAIKIILRIKKKTFFIVQYEEYT